MIGTKTGKSVLMATPAYGRSYETIEAAIADWNAGKDFRQFELPGLYFSSRDAKVVKAEGYVAVEFYDSKRGRLGSVFL
jgi:hypothetical protein